MIEMYRDIKYLVEKRLNALKKLSPQANLVQVLLGPRQVGKTTAVRQIEKAWEGPVIFATADLPAAPAQDWIRMQWQAARSFGDPRTLLVLDEVQKIANWSSMIKALVDEERLRPFGLRVVLLGSASWTHAEGLGETLAGRFEVIRAHHWDYKECKQAFGWDLLTFLKYGGYPVPAQFIDDPDRWRRFMMDSIIEPMLSKDILPLRQIAKPALFRQAFVLAMSYPAMEMSLNKMLGQLQDGGNTTTLRHYLDLMQSGYVLRLLEKHSTRALSRKSSSPKLLPLCPALIHTFAPHRKMDEDLQWSGHVFESVIGAHLCRYFEDVGYWRDGTSEVDFVLALQEWLIAVEVKSGRPKSASGLIEFRRRFPKAETVLMDRDLGERFLLAEDPRMFLLSVLDMT